MSFTLPEGYWVLGEGQHPAWPIGGKALGLVRLLAAGCPYPAHGRSKWDYGRGRISGCQVRSGHTRNDS